MILADKIINLRKKNGLSQEELAEMVGVSRQSISKYEGAQSIPDLTKIIKFSKIFGVSIDYLVNDEIEEIEYINNELDDNEVSCYKVTLEMAREFLEIRKDSAKKCAFATGLCIAATIPLIFFAGLNQFKPDNINISENVATVIGLLCLSALIIIAISIFMINNNKLKKYEFLKIEQFETEYGVEGMVKEEKEKFSSKYIKFNILGMILCIFSIIPILLFNNGFNSIIMICLLLFMLSCGVYFFVLGGSQMKAMNCLLEEKNYTKNEKKIKKKISPFMGAFWSVIIIIYIVYGYFTNNWGQGWIIWVIAAIMSGVFYRLLKGISQKDNK